MITRIVCLLLALVMMVGVFASCKGPDQKPSHETTQKPSSGSNEGNNGGNGGNGGNSGNSGSNGSNGNGGNTGEAPSPDDKYPWLNHLYRFSEETFTAASNEKNGIIAYLAGLGAIAADETDEEKINDVLNTLGYEHRKQVWFTTANTVRIVSDDFTTEANFLYKFDVYKNLILYDVSDTSMQDKLDLPSYTLSLDGKSLTLKVPFIYTTVDGEGNPSTVACKSYSTLIFTRDETVKLDDVPAVTEKGYVLQNYAYRFASEEALADFESEKGMPLSAWLAAENATITENNAGVLRVEAGNKLVCEKIVGNGIAISEFSYYISMGAGGAVTLYNTEKGRDGQDTADVVPGMTVFFTVDGKTAVIAEGTDVQRLRVYAFEKELEDEIIPGVSGKIYKLGEYTYRFASDEDRVALETEQGKTLDAIIAELNATVTENRYKTLTVTDDGKVVCETVTESGSVIADFTYYAIVGEDGVMALYKTAAGRDNADAGELVTDVAVTVTAQGVEVATPIAAGSSSMQIEVYRFDRDFEEESVSDPKGNIYLLAEYGYKFATDTDITLLENATGKTVSVLLAELNATITEATRRTLTVDQSGRFLCDVVTEGGVATNVFAYYGVIGEEGKVTLYKTAEGRDNADEAALVTDVVITVKAAGIEMATPIMADSESRRVEVYAFEKEMETVDLSDPRGNAYKILEYGYQFAGEEDLSALENATGKTAAALLAELNATITKDAYRTLAVDRNGRFLCSDVIMSGVTVTVFSYYGVIGDDGKVTLYKTAAGRENADASELVNDVAITVKATGIEVATSIPEVPQSKQTELYVFDKELPKYDGIPTIAGTGYASANAEVRYASEQEKSHFDEEGYSSEVLFGMANSGRTVYFDTYGRMYSVKTEGDLQTVEWIYHFSVDEKGVIIRYKTEAGRDSQDAADVVKDENSFFLSPDGRRMEWHQEILNGYSTKVVTFFDFLKTISENEPEVKNKVYLSHEETPLIWIFDRDLVLMGMQGSRVLYTYYGKIINSNMIFYTDSDAREYDDQNYLVPDLAGIVLPCIDTIVLPDGTEVRYNAAYSNAAAPTLSFKSDIQTEYIAASRLSIDISESVVTNSDGGLAFEWFEGTGMWKEHIDHAPRTEGEYTLRVITKPTAQYAMAQKDIAITIISLEEMTAGYTAINMGDLIDRISNGLWFKTQKGQNFIINYTCDERKDVIYCIHFTELSEGSQVRVFDSGGNEIPVYLYYSRIGTTNYYWIRRISDDSDLEVSYNEMYTIVLTAGEDDNYATVGV